MLDDIAGSCLTEELGDGFYGIGPSKPGDLSRELEKLAKARNPDVRRVAAAALDFTRRRFAKELAEAEKAEKAAPKPKKPKP